VLRASRLEGGKKTEEELKKKRTYLEEVSKNKTRSKYPYQPPKRKNVKKKPSKTADHGMCLGPPSKRTAGAKKTDGNNEEEIVRVKSGATVCHHQTSPRKS